MLYELIAIVRPISSHEVKDIARAACNTILRHSGVVRGITNWGSFLLPRPASRHQMRHHKGHHFLLRFDSDPAAQAEVRRTLALDPRMIRFSVVKLGDRLGGHHDRDRVGALEDIPGDAYAEWGGRDRDLGVVAFSRRQGRRPDSKARGGGSRSDGVGPWEDMMRGLGIDKD